MMLVTDLVPHVFPYGGVYPESPLSDGNNAFTDNTTVHLRTYQP
jgi:hypothetical protein